MNAWYLFVVWTVCSYHSVAIVNILSYLINPRNNTVQLPLPSSLQPLLLFFFGCHFSKVIMKLKYLFCFFKF